MYSNSKDEKKKDETFIKLISKSIAEKFHQRKIWSKNFHQRKEKMKHLLSLFQNPSQKSFIKENLSNKS